MAAICVSRWMSQTMHRAIVVLVITGGSVGCTSTTLPSAPASPPSPPTAPPTVTAVSPSLGSTDGGTEVKITGANLAAAVSFGGAAVQGRFDSRYPGALMLLSSPAHAAGAVDVVVSGQNGQSVTLSNAFTYAPPQMFDFNGSWSGFGRNGQDNLIRFTVENGMLLRVSCDSLTSAPDAVVTFSPPRAVSNNAFSFSGDGMTFSGRIVGPSSATGTIRLGDCASDSWYATKQ